MKLSKILLGSAILGGIGAATALCLYKNKRTIPKGVKAVKPFDIKRYLGKWHEIARFDFFFENHMENVIAEYSLNFDGSIRVVNSGYNYKKKKYKISVGKAIIGKVKNEAKLKVSFFGPFYSGYNVIAIDDEYKYALVSGYNRDYLWILSREKEMPQEIIEEYLSLAKNLGYDTSKLIWTKQF